MAEQIERGYATAGRDQPREPRVVEQLTERVRKIDSGIIHAIGQASELRSRLLGERDPSPLSKASGINDRVPSPISCDIDELRKVLVGMEANIENLHGHLNSLGQL